MFDNDEDEDFTPADIQTIRACFMFSRLFADYVKENDVDLWHRAREFALDFTEVDGVTITDTFNK